MRILPFVALATTLVFSPVCRAQQGAGSTLWHTDLPAAIKTARAESKPLLLLFRCEP